jgi:transcriptional regulator with GAF, ATPase, and Fis domain
MVALPPLRDRPEEIAALVVSACAESAIHAHVSLVEQCLLRAWPGNIRELLAEIRAAASAARVDGDRVMGKHLAPSAGSAFSQVDAPTVESIEPPRKRAPPVVDDAWRQRIEDALRANGGKVAAAARALGLHRTQLRRMIERNGIAVAPDDPGDD